MHYIINFHLCISINLNFVSIKGSQYYRYNTYTDRADEGYPRNISVWRGLPQRIDASLQYNGITYFFADGLYYR